MEYKIPQFTTLREALKRLYPDSSRRTLQKWIQAGRFSVNGRRLDREDVSLLEGQTLISQETCCPPKVPGIKILYEDRHLIAIEKPEGLLSVPLDEGTDGKNVLDLLKKGFRSPSIFAVHRIDRDVSGALVFARGKEAEERLKILFEKHDLHREYFAIVEGRLREDRGIWNSRLVELSNYDVVESPEGRESITHFEVIRRSAKFTYLKIVLETGRKHQIRVHCQRAGFPVVGDTRYGATANPIRRLCLHAHRLDLKHPFTGRLLSITSPVPRNFQVIGGLFSSSKASTPRDSCSALEKKSYAKYPCGGYTEPA